MEARTGKDQTSDLARVRADLWRRHRRKMLPYLAFQWAAGIAFLALHGRRSLNAGR